MQITYIKHSSFLVEWEDAACLFDYVDGDLPVVDEAKRLFVFASHAHSDHYTPELFGKLAGHKSTTFLLSDDIRPDHEAEGASTIIRMAPNTRRIFTGGASGALSVSTLGSTDCGVAFVVNYAGKSIYHAGDLHWWAWPDDTPQEEKEMKDLFAAEIVKLKGTKLDAAFVPLDPRLGGNFWMGLDAVMRIADIGVVFPMHMWEHYDYVNKLRQLNVSAPYRDRIAEIRAPGQVFAI